MSNVINYHLFRISPLIKIPLFSLYFSLTIPLPFLAKVNQTTPISPQWLWVLIGLGAIALYGALSETVSVNDQEIKVSYPRWFRVFINREWSLKWQDIKELKMRTTGQGGLVYYFITETRDQAYLLPMRIAGFNRLVTFVQEKTGIDTKDIYPMSQPWMYLTMFGFTIFLWLIDAWLIQMVLTHSF